MTYKETSNKIRTNCDVIQDLKNDISQLGKILDLKNSTLFKKIFTYSSGWKLLQLSIKTNNTTPHYYYQDNFQLTVPHSDWLIPHTKVIVIFKNRSNITGFVQSAPVCFNKIGTSACLINVTPQISHDESLSGQIYYQVIVKIFKP